LRTGGAADVSFPRQLFLCRSYPQPFSRGFCGVRREMVVGNSAVLRRLIGCYFHEFPVFVIIGQFPRAVEDGKRIIPIAMDHHPHPNVMATIFVRRDLQFITIHADTVVVIDGSFLLLAKDVIQIFPNPRKYASTG